MEDTRPAGCHNPPPRCSVCGGPFPDGSGCEYCPKVPAPEYGAAIDLPACTCGGNGICLACVLAELSRDDEPPAALRLLPEPAPLVRSCIGCGRRWDDHTEAERFACVAWNARAGVELEPEALHGDVDINGDLVDLLVVRLRQAVGPDIADDVDAAGQVRLAQWLLEAAGHDTP